MLDGYMAQMNILVFDICCKDKYMKPYVVTCILSLLQRTFVTYSVGFHHFVRHIQYQVADDDARSKPSVEPMQMLTTAVVCLSEDDTGAVIVQTAPGKVVTHRGGSITLPCRFHHEPENVDPARIRIKWTKVTDALQFEDVFVALGR